MANNKKTKSPFNPELISVDELKNKFDKLDDDGDGLIANKALIDSEKLIGLKIKDFNTIIENLNIGENIDFKTFLFICSVNKVLKKDENVDLGKLKDNVFEYVIRLNPDKLRTQMGNYNIQFEGDLEKYTDICDSSDSEDSLEDNEEFQLQLNELKEAFDLCHYKKSENPENDLGVISKEELKIAMKSFRQNLSNAELDEVIAEADANGDNAIDFPEFVLIFKRLLGKPTKQDRKNHFDKETNELINKLFTNGNLDADKLKYEMKKLGVEIEGDLDALIEEADINNDGKFDTNEFLEMMNADAKWVLSPNITNTK